VVCEGARFPAKFPKERTKNGNDAVPDRDPSIVDDSRESVLTPLLIDVDDFKSMGKDPSGWFAVGTALCRHVTEPSPPGQIHPLKETGSIVMSLGNVKTSRIPLVRFDVVRCFTSAVIDPPAITRLELVACSATLRLFGRLETTSSN
jgi:hypothetical protein